MASPVNNSGRQRKLTEFGGVSFTPSFKKCAEMQIEELSKLKRNSKSTGSSQRQASGSVKRRNISHLQDISPNPVRYQTVIDANQRVIGTWVCSACQFVGDLDDEEDKKIHEQEHAKFLREQAERPDTLKFSRQLFDATEIPLKTEKLSGFIVPVIFEQSSTALRNKAKECLRFAEQQMGSIKVFHLTSSTDIVLLFVTDTCPHYVVGCVSAERVSPEITSGVSCDDASSCCSTPAVSSGVKANYYCGVSLMWVASGYRRKGVALEMIKCLRSQYNRWCHYHGSSIELAFSEPTDAGMTFIRAYSGKNGYRIYQSQRKSVSML